MAKTKGNISYTISDIANDLNTDKRFLRFCEEKGLISPKISTFSRRIFSEYDRARLELILHCEASGYALDQVIDLIGTPDPGLDKAEQFRNGLAHGERRLDELIKQSEEVSFHQRTNIMTDVNLMKQYVKNLQAIKTNFLDEFEAKPKPPAEEKIELEPKAAVKPVAAKIPEKEEKPPRQPARVVPIFAVGIVLVLMIAGYVYYQNTTQETKTLGLAKDQGVEMEEAKELPEKAPEEIQQETKIVLSKAYPEDQAAPAPQEQPEAAVEPPAQPDTEDKTQKQVPETETKDLTVAAVTEEKPSTPAVVVPPPAETAPPTPAAAEAKSAETTQADDEPKKPATQEQSEVVAETPPPVETTAPTPPPAEGKPIKTIEAAAEPEKPAPQEQPKAVAEIPQPAAEPTAQPDTEDKTQEQVPESETKNLTVAAVTEEKSSTPVAVEPSPAETAPPTSEAAEAKPAETTQADDEPEKPAAKEQSEVVAETAPPVETKSPTPPAADEKPQEQAPKPETKDLTVAAGTQEKPSTPAVVAPPPAETAIPAALEAAEAKPMETKEPASDPNTLAVTATEDATKVENPENRLKAFLAYYCRIYETKDMDKFFSLFTADATENDTSFDELKPKYQKNMEIIESLQYRIDMTDYSSIPETGNTLVQGKFFIKYRLQGKPWKEHSGNVTMELTQRDDSYRVKRLNYGN